MLEPLTNLYGYAIGVDYDRGFYGVDGKECGCLDAPYMMPAGSVRHFVFSPESRIEPGPGMVVVARNEW